MTSIDASAAGHAAELDRRIGGMRALLAAMRPGSDAEALRVLRAAFPDLPLAERVSACRAWKA